MEITLTEFLLFVWAAVATGFAFKYKELHSGMSFLLNKFLEDEELRNDMVGKYKQWKGSRNGR